MGVDAFLTPGTPLNLSAIEREKLGQYLVELGTDLETSHKDLLGNIDTLWNLYEAKPLQKRRTDPFDGAPLARDTEVLTLEGWVRVDELSIGQLVLTRRDEDGLLQWQPILATPRVWAEELIWFKSRSLDQQVTPGHQTISTDRYGKNPKRMSAEELWNTTNRRIPMVGMFQGEKPDTLYGLPSGDVLELFGWYISEGWSNKDKDKKPSGTLFLGQSRTANPEKCARIEALLDRLGISWVYAKSNSCYCIHARSFSPELAKQFRELGLAHEKFIPSWMFKLDPSLLERLFESLILGDGHTTYTPIGSPDQSYYTVSRRLADDVQTLCALIGLSGSIHIRDRRGVAAGTGNGVSRFVAYEVNVRRSVQAKVDKAKFGRITYNDYAYCVTVENHAIYIRRDGKPSWTGNSNIVVPLIRMHSDAIKSRLQNVVFAAPDLWTFRTRNEEMTEVARSTTDFLNWAADDNEFDVYTPNIAAFDEAIPIGSGIVMLGWANRKRWIFSPGDGGRPQPRSVELSRGPTLTHIPREQILWQVGRSVQDSEYAFVQSWKTWGDLCTLEQTGGIDEGYLEKVRAYDGASSSYSSGIRKSKLNAGGLSDTNDSGNGIYDIRQWWVEWPVLRGIKFEDIGEADRKTPLIPLCVTIDHTSGTVLRVAAKPYYTRSWPFYDYQFRSSSRGPNPKGVAQLLEHLQRAATIMLNQSIDAVTLANSLNLITNDRRFLSQRFIPGRPMFADNISQEAIREMVLSKQITPDIALINLVFSLAERLTGINDPSLGRETRYGGHPSPATSTALMLQESKEMQKTTVKHTRLQFGRMAEDIGSLYQQYESKDSGKIARALGMEDASKLQEWTLPQGPIAGNIEFDLRAATENINPEAEREQAIFTMQATGAFYGQVMQALQVAAHPQSPPPVKAAAIRSVEALATGFEKVLAAAQVDDIKKFIFKLQESNGNPGVIREVANAVSNELGGMATARGQRALPPVATGADGLPVGSTGAPVGSGF